MFGKEIFTYAVLFVIGAASALLFSYFIFTLKIKKTSQYFWLLLCTGLYAFFTIQLRQHPEEAMHLLEYSLLSFFVFRALSHRICDWTIYLSTLLFTLFFGITDEFIQWMVPERYWALNDVGINFLAGAIFVLALWKGIAPRKIGEPVRRRSVNRLAGMMVINLIFIGACLSNTPDMVKKYTSISPSLTWLRNEEPMTEYGYEHRDPEIGTFYSRLTLHDINETDHTLGETYGELIRKEDKGEENYKILLKKYTPNTNIFMHEYLIHVSRRDSELDEFRDSQSKENKFIALKENRIVEKYFGNTLKHSGQLLPLAQRELLGDASSFMNEDYSSQTGRIITAFKLRTVWFLVIIIAGTVWASAQFWKRRLSAG